MAADPTTPKGRAGDAIRDRASRWLARRDRGLSAAEHDAFLHWLAADPRHAAEFARQEAVWNVTAFASASPELVALAEASDRRAAAKARNRRGGLVALPFAAAAAAAVALAWWRPGTEMPGPNMAAPSYEVLASAARRVVLADGSVVELRGDSTVRAEFTAQERRVVLASGEAHFAVTKDPARPFSVVAGAMVVRAVGTAFNVRLEEQRVEVLVTEGSVAVAAHARAAPHWPAANAPRVRAGERAILDPAARADVSPRIVVSPAGRGEIEQALAWQSTRLVFRRTALADAVAAFNRHAGPSAPRLVVADPVLGGKRFGGTFRAENADAFVRLLEQSADVVIERREREIVLRPAR